MKNLFTFGLGISLLIFAGLGCRNPLAKYTKQYNCSVPGEAEPQTADDYVKRGYKHIELNNYSNDFDQCAFDAAQEALRLNPQTADALALRGNMYRAKREYDPALDDFNEAIRIDPGNPHFYQFRSSVFELKNMPKEALDDLSHVIKNGGDSHFNYAKRGELYFKREEFENALKDYTEAIRLKPDYENHYTMRAEVYRKLGKTAEAEADELKAKSFEEIASIPPGGSDSKTISGGVLNGKAKNLVKPPYPPAARAVRASGAVNVQVTIDENGNVISASAVSGHPLLRAAAVNAARASKFSPTRLSGKPVKVTGVIVYNFSPE